MSDDVDSVGANTPSGLPRRDFLKQSVGAAIAVVSGGVPSTADAAQDAAATSQVSRAWPQSKRAPSSVISLPKSGGAVGGIGETFVPNLQTGTEGVSVPLPFTKGRDGFNPDLSLSYSVANGNGIFGLGWQLDLPDISRKTQGRLPRYDPVDDDAFLLNGAELRADGNVAQERATHDVSTYRLRHEGPFSRIERWTRRTRTLRDPTEMDVFWCVTSRDNITQIFGATTDAVVANPERPERIFRWALQLVYDGKGNVIQYQCKPEDGAGVPAEEHKRLVAQTYLKRVCYGNLQPVVFADPVAAVSFLGGGRRDGEYFFEGVFDYGEHGRVEGNDAVVADDIHAELRPWPSRVDAFSSYVAGFDVRTRRTCTRFMMFHRVPGSSQPALVGSLDFDLSSPDLRRFQTVTQLKSVVRRGYAAVAGGSRWNESEDYLAGQRRGVRSQSHEISSIPPLVFDYTLFEPPSLSTAKLRVRVDEQLPARRFQNADVTLIDMAQRGVPDILWTRGDDYHYWKNSGDGLFKRDTNVTPPRGADGQKVRLSDVTVGISEITGDAFPDFLVDARTEKPGQAGYCTGQAGSSASLARWSDYTPFKPDLPFRLTDPNLRFVDVTGDGRLDALRSNRGAIEFFENVGPRGFVGPESTTLVPEIEKFRFDDPRIHFADMTGDGLADLVLLDERGVHYWPNLGRGAFGQQVTMQGLPLAFLQTVRPERLHFVDIDGSGPADLVYVEPGTVRCWLNLCGNVWTDGFVVPGPRVADGAPQLVDLLGTGISGLLWTERDENLYLPLAAKKPLLLAWVSNSMGRRTQYEYTPSTRFALDAEDRKKPWKERLAFPIYVLSKIVRHDDIASSRLVSTFMYAHGAYDSAEKAFRGFARVEQRDAEYLSVDTSTSGDPLVRDRYQPPVLTTTWFHTGRYVGRTGPITRQYQDEYYRADLRAPALESSLLASGGDDLAREATLALAGRIVRTEVGPADETPNTAAPRHPYNITEYGYVVEPLPGSRDARTTAFHAREEQRVHLRYELQAGDPQVTHEVVLNVDAYGHVLESASVAYGRRSEGTPEQRRTLATYTVRKYADRTSDRSGFRHGVLTDEQQFELHNLVVSTDASLMKTRLLAAVRDATRIDFDDEPQRVSPQLRLVAHTRHCFWTDDATAAVCDGQIGLLALPHNTYQKAFTPGLRAKVYGSRVDETLPREGGYWPDAQGAWWVPDGDPARGSVVFDARRFYLPVQWNDAFGRISRARYDPFALGVVETTDALMNVTSASIDYQTLHPREIVDVNGNRTSVVYDAMGRVAGTAVAGREDEQLGDSLSAFRANLDYPTIRAYIDDPVRAGTALLARATTRVIHDAWCYYHRASGQGRAGPPPAVSTLARETHATDLLPSQQTVVQQTLVYLDGFGRELQTKVRAARGGWVGSGATLYNNKGKPVKKYEPFFSATHRYEPDAVLTHAGVTPLYSYDAIGRLVRTDKPDGTFTRVEIAPWRESRFDEGDTILKSAWYNRRITGVAGEPERRAAELSRRYAETPTVVHFDALQRLFLTVSDNGPAGKYSTQNDLDIQGRAFRVRDARGNLCLQSEFDMLGRAVRTRSIDSGTRMRLPNILGESIREWDDAGHIVRRRYDELNRPIEVFARRTGEAETLVQRHVYGEAVPDAVARKLRGELYQVHTDAMVVTNEEFDFKRNVIRVRQTAGTNPAAPAFLRTTRYDALNRPTTVTHHSGIEVVTPYDACGKVRAVEVRLRPDATLQPHVRSVEYNARGQRTQMVYDNGVSVDYIYDADTFRLTNLTAKRDSAMLQDLVYTYDAAGNVVEVYDRAQPVVCHGNQQIEPRSLYEYDAVYRLTSARGREHRSFAIHVPEDRWTVQIEPRSPHVNDCQALAKYHQKYGYDEVGNLRRVDHQSSSGGWVLEYEYAPTSNRLVAAGRAGDMRAYSYDENGNVAKMPHSEGITWDYANHLRSYQEGQVRAAYGYDGAGTRVRKTVERGPVTDDRVYAGDYERFARRRDNKIELVRHTTHARIGKLRVSSVESTEDSATVRTRFLLHDHLESARFEVDDSGAMVSYEEYHPFGTTAYWAGPNAIEVSEKRFRYFDKELDEESGLYYFGARYYAPWLGRWISCDPIGVKDGPNLYAYVGNNPVRYTDETGLARKDELDAQPAAPAKVDPKAATPAAPAKVDEGQPTRIPLEGGGYEKAHVASDPKTGETVTTGTGRRVFDFSDRPAVIDVSRPAAAVPSAQTDRDATMSPQTEHSRATSEARKDVDEAPKARPSRTELTNPPTQSQATGLQASASDSTLAWDTAENAAGMALDVIDLAAGARPTPAGAGLFAVQLLVGVFGFVPSSSPDATRYIGAAANHVSLFLSAAALYASGGSATPFAWGSLSISAHQVGSFWAEEIPAPNAFQGTGVHLSDTEMQKAWRVNNAYLTHGGISGPTSMVDHGRY